MSRGCTRKTRIRNKEERLLLLEIDLLEIDLGRWAGNAAKTVNRFALRVLFLIRAHPRKSAAFLYRPLLLVTCHIPFRAL